jgi:hypothetical protein
VLGVGVVVVVLGVGVVGVGVVGVGVLEVGGPDPPPWECGGRPGRFPLPFAG